MNLKHILRNEVSDDGADLGASTVLDAPVGEADPAPATPTAVAAEPTEAAPTAVAAEPTAEPTPPAFPEDWRTQLANGDEKRLKQLERITDVNKFAESYFNAQDKIRSGETSTGLPENPTDEQLAAYREANNIPEKASDYSLALDEGLVLGEDDQRIMDSVYEVAHAANVPGSVLSELTNAMMAGREEEAHAVQQQHGLDAQTATRQLKEAWGHDFEMNKGLVKSMLNGLPEAVRDEFASARLANGKAVFNSPEMMNFFADAARAMNPSATVVPAGTSNPLQAIETRLAELTNMMGEPDWHSNQNAQKEYMNLLDAQKRMV